MTLSPDSLLSAAIDWLSGGLLQLAWWQVLLIGLVLRIPLVKFNKWYVAKVESTKVIS